MEAPFVLMGLPQSSDKQFKLLSRATQLLPGIDFPCPVVCSFISGVWKSCEVILLFALHMSKDGLCDGLSQCYGDGIPNLSILINY